MFTGLSVRRFLPELIDLVWTSKIDPGKVFDLTLPLEQVAQALYRDKSNAIVDICRTLHISRATLYKYLKTGTGKPT